MTQARSALGELVDFNLISIKQQLASAPASSSVNDRRKFIDQRDGFRTRTVIAAPADTQADSVTIISEESVPSSKKSK